MGKNLAPSALFIQSLAALALGAAILAFDLFMPLGVAGGVPNVALVLLGIWFPARWHIFALALAGSALTILGYFLSPEGGITWVVLTNRGLALLAIWVSALLLANYKQKLAIPYQISWRAMGDYQRIVTLILIMTAVALTIAGTAIGILYDTAFEEQRERLREVAQSQARMMEAMARHEQREEEHDDNLESTLVETLAQIRDAHENYRGLGETGELVLARREDKQITFLLSHRHSELDEPEPISLDSRLAEPMRRALAGRSGTMTGLDYRGETVLAAHEPVAHYDLAVVAKIDLTEIRAPFIRAGILVAIIACIVIAIGTALFVFVSNPIIRQLLAAKERAEISDRSKTDFLANMSHELRTPLNSVIGFSDMMRGEILGEMGNAKYVEYANDINYSGTHLLGVIDEILDVSKMESGNQRLIEAKVDIGDAIHSSMAMLEQRLREARITLTMDIEDGLPALFADVTRLKQIILNLVGNAIKFSPVEGHISISAVLDRQGALSLRVADRGIGIAPENLEKILHPFIQVENVMTRGHPGSGLGLPLAKSFMELHGGSLVIESEVGVGTTVTCRFPAERTRALAA